MTRRGSLLMETVFLGAGGGIVTREVKNIILDMEGSTQGETETMRGEIEMNIETNIPAGEG